MKKGTSMKRWLVGIKTDQPRSAAGLGVTPRFLGSFMSLCVLLASLLSAHDSYARASRGRSSGKSYSKPHSAPHQSGTRQVPSQSAASGGTPTPGPTQSPGTPPVGGTGMATSPSIPRPAPQRSGFMGQMATAVAGGFLGSMLFSGLSHGFGNGASSGFSGEGGSRPLEGSRGIGLIEILLLGALGYLGYRLWKNRREKLAMEPQMGRYSSSDPAYKATSSDGGPWKPSLNTQMRSLESYQGHGGGVKPSFMDDPEIGLSSHESKVSMQEYSLDSDVSQEIRSLDARELKKAVREIFFKVQVAWSKRQLDGVKMLMTEDMLASLEKDMQELVAKRQINRLENIAIGEIEILNTWTEGRELFAGVQISAMMLDYLVDETTSKVLEGSDMEPVQFEETWVFRKEPSSSLWQLAGIDPSN